LGQAQLANAQAQQQNYNTAQQTGLGAMGNLTGLAGGLSNAYLQNASLGLQGLTANNSAALNALGQNNTLMSTLGSIYSPANYLNATNSAYGSLLTSAQDATNAGLGGINSASSLMGNLATSNTGNNALYNSLIGAGGSVLGTLLKTLIPQATNTPNTTGPGTNFTLNLDGLGTSNSGTGLG
jgi:hypothetical protein